MFLMLTATSRIPARLREGLSRREKFRMFSPTANSSSFTVSAYDNKTTHNENIDSFILDLRENASLFIQALFVSTPPPPLRSR